MRVNFNLIKSIIVLIATKIGFVSSAQEKENSRRIEAESMSCQRITKSEEEWKKSLTSFEYHVLREKGTERAFTGSLLNNKLDGIYKCAACGLPLFDSETKFRSGTGWPSFYKPVSETSVFEVEDTSYGMVRMEVLCARCDGHLGHVFSDQSQSTGLRYCINSASLRFDADSVAD